jgi:effector-binding domain-containing protein
MNWGDWPSILSLLIHIGFFIIILKGWKKKSIWTYAILFYLITLSIVSNLFVSVGTFMNERFVYHASLGFCIAVAWLLVEKMSHNPTLKKIALTIFNFFTIGMSAITLIRLPDWKSIKSLDEAALKVSSNSARTNHFYGVLIWNSVYMKLPAGTDPARRRADLDSLNPYFEKALQILPSYNSANAMKAGIAGEYHKLDQNYEKLIKAFEEVNLTGTYEKFILEYLKFVNPRVSNRKDALLLAAFYERMIEYNNRVYKNTTLPADYRSLLNEIQGRIPGLQ